MIRMSDELSTREIATSAEPATDDEPATFERWVRVPPEEELQVRTTRPRSGFYSHLATPIRTKTPLNDRYLHLPNHLASASHTSSRPSLSDNPLTCTTSSTPNPSPRTTSPPIPSHSPPSSQTTPRLRDTKSPLFGMGRGWFG